MITALLALLAQPATVPSLPEAVVPDDWKKVTEDLHYSPAVKAGGMVYLSGIVAGVPGHMPDAPLPDAEAQEQAYEWAFGEIGEILAASGSDWDHVVSLTTFHTDLQGTVGPLMTVKDRYIEAPYPAWTAIDIDRLYPDGGLVEIVVIAAERDGGE